MKTIGVLGGTGPQATMQFESHLHQAAQRLIPPSGNSGYPPLVVLYHRRPPFVMREGHVPVLPFQADPDYLDAARWLGTRADFLVITANGAHMVRAQVEQAAGRPVVSMIDAALAEVRRRAWRRVGLLGFVDPRVLFYAEPLRAIGLACETIDAPLQLRLDAAIMRVHEGRDTDEHRAVAHAAVAALRARAVDGIILGCTEIPILLQDAASADDLIDPLPLLAEAAVKHALS